MFRREVWVMLGIPLLLIVVGLVMAILMPNLIDLPRPHPDVGLPGAASK
jgi:hypothetical protein